MNKDQQYQEYLGSGGQLPYEEFVSAAMLLSSMEEPVKKKDQSNPTESGNPTLTNEFPSVPPNFSVPMGSEQDLPMLEAQQYPQTDISASSGIVQPQVSTDLPLTATVSSGVENSNPPIEGIAQQPTYTKPSVGAMLYPIGNEEIGQYNERVAQRNRTITAKSDLSNTSVQNGISKPLKQVKTSLFINTDINKESLIDEEGNKIYTEINGFTIPNALLPDPNDNYNILYDRDGNLNPWIKADKINLDELKPARFNEYTSSITDDVEGDNNNILQQSKLGNVEIKTENGEYAKDKDGKLVYKFTNKDYYDKTYVPYVEKVNAERTKKEEETNLDATYANRIISEKPNSELDDLYDDFEQAFGRKPTDEERLSVYNQESLLNFRANIEVERLKKLDPNADENVLRQQALNKLNAYTPSDIQTGSNVLNLINESFQRDASNENYDVPTLFKDNNNGQFRSNDADEFNQWNSISKNQAELGSFGKYWKEEGEAEFGSSWVKQRQITYQEKRLEIMGAYLDWKKRDLRILDEAKTNLIKQSKWNTKQAAEKGNAELTNTTATATATLLNDYGQFVNNLKAQENNDIEIYSKFKREQDKFIAQQNAKTDFINGEDKPAQYAANIVLGFASSIQSTITGVARLASLPFGEGNFSDAVDVMGKPLGLGKYSSAPLSLNIKRYEGGVDEGGNKFEYREVNGDQYSYSNGKYTKLFGKIPKKAKFIDNKTEYSAAGFLFQGSKMATDIMLTQGMGSVINKGIGSVSSKVFKFSRANTLANTKNLASVFGSESLLARGSASLYKASRNVNNASVTGWTVQMTEDSYQQGKKAGLEGKYLIGYTLFNSGLQSLIQRINPDVKFLKSIKTDHYNLTQALLSKNTDKALLYFNNIKGKVVGNAGYETVEESVQQVTQDFTNLFTNSLTGSNLTFATANEYRDILVSTPILAGALGASMGRNGKATANIGGRNVDISSLTTAELETEIARNKGSEKFIKEYINSAYFDSVKERATEILNSIETRSKYISKIPKQEQYSTNTITQAAVLLQQKSKLEKELNETDDAMKFLVEGDLEATKTKIRELFDSANINTNFNSEIEKSNAETAQTTPQSEAVQEQTDGTKTTIDLNAKTGDTLYNNETQQSQVETQSEQPTIAGEQNVPSELNPAQDNSNEKTGEKLYHTSNTVLTLDDISVEPRKSRQSKRGTTGGFYTYNNLADIEKFSKGNKTINTHEIQLKPDVEIKDYSGSIERLDASKLKELRDQGYQVIRGKSIFGKEEIVVIDKSAIESVKVLDKATTETIKNQDEINTEIERIKTLDGSERVAAEIKLIMGNLFAGVGEASANKIKEYADRITSGKESRDSVIQGLPKSFINGIDSLVSASKNDNEIQLLNTTENGNQQESEQVAGETSSQEEVGENTNFLKEQEDLSSRYKKHVTDYLAENNLTEEQYKNLSPEERKTIDAGFQESPQNKMWVESGDQKQSEKNQRKISSAKVYANGVAQGQIENGYKTATQVKNELEQFGVTVPKDILEKANLENETSEVTDQDLLQMDLGLAALNQKYAATENTLNTPTNEEQKNSAPIAPKTSEQSDNTPNESGTTSGKENINSQDSQNEVDQVEEDDQEYEKAREQEKIDFKKENTPTQTEGTVLTETQQKTNYLIGLKNEYNKLSVAKKSQTKGKELFSKINQVARELGITTGNLGDGKISIKNPKTGKEMAKIKESISEKIPTKKEIETAKQYIPDLVLWNRDMASIRWDSDISRADVDKGAEDINNGKTNTIPARRLINEVNRQINDYGGFDFIEGSGSKSQKSFASLQEIADSKAEFPRVWDSLDNLNDQEINQLYNERFESEKEFYTNGPSQDENNSVYEERQDIPSESSGNDQSQAELTSPEYKSLVTQRNDQEARVKTAKSKLDAVSKTTNRDFQGDQEDLFGERPAQQGMFDERADGNAGKELIATAKREYDQAKAELSRLNNAVRDFESGKVTGTESINFESVDSDKLRNENGLLITKTPSLSDVKILDLENAKLDLRDESKIVDALNSNLDKWDKGIVKGVENLGSGWYRLGITSEGNSALYSRESDRVIIVKSKYDSIAVNNIVRNNLQLSENKPDNKKSPLSKPTEKIDDFGEKIGGAKKDFRANLENITDESIATQPLSKSFPRPDFKKLVDSKILTKEQAIFFNYLYDQIPAKPRKPYLLNAWTTKVKYVIDTFSSLMTDSDIDVVGRIRESATLGTKFKLYEDIYNEFGFPNNPVSMGAYEIKKLTNAAGEYFAIVKGSRIVSRDLYSVKEAVESLKAIIDKNKATKGDVKLSLYQDTKTKKYFIGKKGVFSTIRLIEFDDVKEGRSFLENNKEQLQEMWESQKETQKERDGKLNDPRIGTDYRKGEDVTPKKFSDTFGFRGVEFGNYVNNNERQTALNEAYDAFMDLSTIIGVSPKALSLNGKLAMAFGARGSGNAMAHYEPTRVVINLTKTKGAGSLAHEWWHAFDNYLSGQRGKESEMLTDSPRYKGKDNTTVREEISDAFVNLVKTIKDSPLYKRSRAADAAKSKPYFSTSVEMTARAFENYVVLKMAEAGERNHYLANFNEHAVWVKNSRITQDTYPYPLEAEAPGINKAYQDLFGVLKEKKEGDNIALFQKSEQKFETISQKTFDNLIERLKKPFSKAFGNLNVTTDFNSFKSKAKQLGLNINFDAKFQIDANARKKKQLELINKTNPAPNNYNTWIRSETDIKTAQEAFNDAFSDGEMYPDFTVEDMQNVLNSGEVTIYSSYPIKEGVFVTPSRMNAESYAGNGKIYSKKVNSNSLAWIDEGEGQFAPVQMMHTAKGELYGAKLPDGTIYINPEKLNANTPIHEFSHLWEQIMPSAWKKGLAIFKETTTGKKLYNQLQKEGNYSKLSEDQVWSEAMNTHIGNLGEAQYQRSPKGKMAEFIDWFKTTMGKFFDVLGIKKLNKEQKLSAFTDRVLGDLLGGKELRTEDNLKSDKQVQFMKSISVAEIKSRIKELWKKSTTEKQGTETIVIGEISADAKNMLAKLSGLSFEKIQNINLNQSNLRHIFNEHYNTNEKDKGSNIPLSTQDIQNLPEILNSPDQIIYGKENGVNVFFFVKEANNGSIVTVQVYSGKNKNLNVRTMYRSKKDSNQRADELYSSLSTPKTRSGAPLSDANILNISDNKINFQIIGEQGAENLDLAEEATTRLDNLGIAREMEAANKTPKEIRLATGWERGADKKWKYEIADGNFRDEVTDYIDKVKGLNNSDGFIYSKSDVQLKDIFDIGSDLSKAHPYIENIRVDIDVQTTNTNKGSLEARRYGNDKNYYPSKLDVQANSIEQARSIILHEIQHSIQNYEGFAKGGSIKNNLDAETTKQVYQVEKLIKDAVKLKNENEWLTEGKTVSDLIQYEKWDHKNEVIEWAMRIADKGQAEIDTFLKETPLAQYQRLAGETEARNVQTRANMSNDDRRALLLSETEDVAQEDQIILMEYSGVQESNSGDDSFLNKSNPIPVKTINEVVSVAQSSDLETATEKLKESAWYGRLSEAKKQEVKPENLISILNDNANVLKEKAKEAKNKAVENAVDKTKTTYKNRIEEIKSKYKSRIEEIKQSNQNDKDKVKERRKAIRESINDIKSFLASNKIDGKATPTEINRLIKAANGITGRRDIGVAMNEFFQLYSITQQKAENRKIKAEDRVLTDVEFEDLSVIVKDQIDNGMDQEAIYDFVKKMDLPISKVGTLSEKIKSVIDKISAQYEMEQLSPAQKLERLKESQKRSNETLKNKNENWLRDFKRKAINKFTDRQFVAKKLVSELGLINTYNRIIVAGGASSAANSQFEEAYKKIYKGLTIEERKNLDRLITLQRIISIEDNRKDRGLESINHTEGFNLESAREVVAQIKLEIGAENFNNINSRAKDYFKEFKLILDAMLKNGIITQESYDAMVNIDYQPRLFVEHLLDADGKLMDDETDKFANESGGIKKEMLQELTDGSTGDIIMNSEWILKLALASRNRQMAQNEVNRTFMTRDFPNAKMEYEKIKAGTSTLSAKEQKRFEKYFEELDSKIKDNPMGVSDTGTIQYKYDTTPAGFKKAYYFQDGIRHEFFMENELHTQWHDAGHGLFKNPETKGKVATYSGSKALKFFATGNNPSFFIANAPRDFAQTLMFSKEYSDFMPLSTLQLLKDSTIGFRELVKDDLGKESLLSKYIQYGGGMDFLHTQGMVKRDNILIGATEKIIKPTMRDKGLFAFQTLTLQKLSRYSEVTFRLAIFNRSLQNQLKDFNKTNKTNYKTVEEIPSAEEQFKEDMYINAAASARSIMDFNQGGTVTKDLESLLPYINAATQGTRVAVDAFIQRPKQTSARLAQAAAFMASTGIGLSYAMFAMFKGDDDDEESIGKKILHAYEGLSKYQRVNSINIITPFKTEKGEYYVMKIAKQQFLSPFIYMMEETMLNEVRRYEGVERESWGNITKNTMWAVNNNITPVNLQLGENPFKASIITDIAGGNAIKNPLLKASMTMTTGYDFFRDQPLDKSSFGKDLPKQLEGIKNDKVEDFYKAYGEALDQSPIRTKAAVESIVTSPDTNAWISLIYGGADMMASDKSAKEIWGEKGEKAYGSITRRLISETSDFNRMMKIKEKQQEAIDQIIIKDEKNKNEVDKMAKAIVDGTTTQKEVEAKFKSLDIAPEEQAKLIKRLVDKVSKPETTSQILDIKYTSYDPKVKAFMINSYYPDLRDGSEKSATVLKMLMENKILSKPVLTEYAKLLKEE